MRLLAFAGIVFAAGTASAVVPPVPRIPAAALDPLDKPAAETPADDPAKIADRIARNAKSAGDKLEGQDVGDATRKTQEEILRDLDALLKKAENPPPMSGGGGGGSDSKPPESPPNDPSGGGPSGGSGSGSSGGGSPKPPPSGGQSGSPAGQGGGGQSEKPSGGGSAGKLPQRGSWRDRLGQQAGGAKPPTGGTPPPTGGQPMGAGTQPMPAAPGGTEVGKAGGGDPTKPGNAQGGNGGTSPPAPPLDDATSKQIWGHLPERMRQQMTQYYREQFMPQYADLLRDYFTALAERDKDPRKP